MGITRLIPPFTGGFFLRSKVVACRSGLHRDKDVSEPRQVSDVLKELRQRKRRSLQPKPIGFIHPSEDPIKMRTHIGILVLSLSLSVIASASRAQELGRCDPSKAVKIIDGALGEGKTLQQAMEIMIKAKVFDGSKACITFIRETSMAMRDPYPRAFRSLWMN